MNKTLGIIIAIVVVLGGGYLLMRAPDKSDTISPAEQNQNTNQTQNTSAEGRVVFSVTDAAADMSGIVEINMNVSKVEVQSATEGWVVVYSTPRTYSLLALNKNNQSELLADANLKTGTYNQIRLTVDSVAVITKTGSKEAKLPSGELRINTKLVVNADSTSSVNFDFLASKSLHVTGNGKYIFAPVVTTQVKSDANVNVDSKDVVNITGGKEEDTNTVGMDVDGSVKLNFQIDNKQKLELDTNNKIKLNGVLY